MKKSKDILYSAGKNDECFTPAYGVRPIIKYIPKGAVVWCPFDKKSSEFVKQIKANGNKVIHSHIHKGKDFYEYEPKEHWDIIISNPPFTMKKEIFQRALSFGKPICLLMTLVWLNDKMSKWVFVEKDRRMELLMFDKRIHYTGDTKITFSSAYYCSDFLPEQIINEGLIL